MRFRFPQTLVYFEASGVDSFGRPAFAAPQQYPCRWEDKISEVLNADGQLVLSRSTVYLAQVLKVGGFVRLGLLTDLAASSWLPEVRKNDGVFEIINVGNVPSLRGNQNLVTLSLL